ncbi:MAG: hypothetical protein ACM3NO_03585 [Deltaproteobacteria bacterium]
MRVLLLVGGAALFARSRKPPVITPEQAQAHIGQTAQVCGQMACLLPAFRTRGQPTFIDFVRPYPHETFTAIIRVLDRGNLAAHTRTAGRLRYAWRIFAHIT